MRSLWHTIRLHRVRVGYYMGFKTGVRRCSCGEEWNVREVTP